MAAGWNLPALAAKASQQQRGHHPLASSHSSLIILLGCHIPPPPLLCYRLVHWHLAQKGVVLPIVSPPNIHLTFSSSNFPPSQIPNGISWPPPICALNSSTNSTQIDKQKARIKEFHFLDCDPKNNFQEIFPSCRWKEPQMCFLIFECHASQKHWVVWVCWRQPCGLCPSNRKLEETKCKYVHLRENSHCRFAPPPWPFLSPLLCCWPVVIGKNNWAPDPRAVRLLFGKRRRTQPQAFTSKKRRPPAGSLSRRPLRLPILPEARHTIRRLFVLILRLIYACVWQWAYLFKIYLFTCRSVLLHSLLWHLHSFWDDGG